MIDRWSRTETIVPNAPMVVSETIDGEAIIMHHGSGHYFNALGSGATIWQAIEQGATIDGITACVAGTYGLAEGDARAVGLRFLRTLAEHDLVKTSDQPASAPMIGAPAPFSEPALGVHVDLADMLLLDPVHDVDEAGWPAPRAAGKDTAWNG